MGRIKTEIDVFWVHGTPYVQRFYYSWESKRTPRIIYDPQDGTYTKKEPEWRGRNKERWQEKIKKQNSHMTPMHSTEETM